MFLNVETSLLRSSKGIEMMLSICSRSSSRVGSELFRDSRLAIKSLGTVTLDRKSKEGEDTLGVLMLTPGSLLMVATVEVKAESTSLIAPWTSVRIVDKVEFQKLLNSLGNVTDSQYDTADSIDSALLRHINSQSHTTTNNEFSQAEIPVLQPIRNLSMNGLIDITHIERYVLTIKRIISSPARRDMSRTSAKPATIASADSAVALLKFAAM